MSEAEVSQAVLAMEALDELLDDGKLEVNQLIAITHTGAPKKKLFDRLAQMNKDYFERVLQEKDVFVRHMLAEKVSEFFDEVDSKMSNHGII